MVTWFTVKLGSEPISLSFQCCVPWHLWALDMIPKLLHFKKKEKSPLNLENFIPKKKKKNAFGFRQRGMSESSQYMMNVYGQGSILYSWDSAISPQPRYTSSLSFVIQKCISEVGQWKWGLVHLTLKSKSCLKLH